MEATKTRATFDPRMRRLDRRARPRVMACGWCKGFVHEEWVSDMQIYVHDEKPVTAHEVLPYPVR